MTKLNTADGLVGYEEIQDTTPVSEDEFRALEKQGYTPVCKCREGFICLKANKLILYIDGNAVYNLSFQLDQKEHHKIDSIKSFQDDALNTFLKINDSVYFFDETKKILKDILPGETLGGDSVTLSETNDESVFQFKNRLLIYDKATQKWFPFTLQKGEVFKEVSHLCLHTFKDGAYQFYPLFDLEKDISEAQAEEYLSTHLRPFMGDIVAGLEDMSFYSRDGKVYFEGCRGRVEYLYQIGTKSHISLSQVKVRTFIEDAGELAEVQEVVEYNGLKIIRKNDEFFTLSDHGIGAKVYKICSLGDFSFLKINGEYYCKNGSRITLSNLKGNIMEDDFEVSGEHICLSLLSNNEKGEEVRTLLEYDIKENKFINREQNVVNGFYFQEVAGNKFLVINHPKDTKKQRVFLYSEVSAKYVDVFEGGEYHYNVEITEHSDSIAGGLVYPEVTYGRGVRRKYALHPVFFETKNDDFSLTRETVDMISIIGQALLINSTLNWGQYIVCKLNPLSKLHDARSYADFMDMREGLRDERRASRYDVDELPKGPAKVKKKALPKKQIFSVGFKDGMPYISVGKDKLAEVDKYIYDRGVLFCVIGDDFYIFTDTHQFSIPGDITSIKKFFSGGSLSSITTWNDTLQISGSTASDSQSIQVSPKIINFFNQTSHL